MQALVIAMAKELPEAHLIFRLEDAIQKYKHDKSEKNKGEFIACLSLLHCRFASEDMTLIEAIKVYEEKTSQMRMFENQKQ